MTANNDSHKFRQKIRQKRRSLSRRVQRLHGISVARRLTSLNSFSKARTIAVYLDTDGELPTKALISIARQKNKRLVLPVLHPFRHGRLLFREWPVNASLTRNRFKIEEPSRQHDVINVKHVDVVIVPLVAFDERCYRIGMGGGFYDRTFAFRHIYSWRKPILIGVAHSLQKVKKINNQSWDIAMDAVITEQERIER